MILKAKVISKIPRKLSNQASLMISLIQIRRKRVTEVEEKGKPFS